MGPLGSDGDGVAVQKAKPKLKVPRRFAVVLLNDDYSTMEFVIEVLKRFFHKNSDDAARIMLEVHHKGRGVAGVYSFEIAETKCLQVNEFAQSQGHPLKCEVEPAE